MIHNVLDTSAYIKLFVAESGSQEMIDFFSRSDERTLSISALTALEARSGIRRRESLGDIDQSAAAMTLATLAHETSRIVEHPINAGILSQAATLVDQYTLRALDALQLATAMYIGQRGSTVRFVSSDFKLLKAASSEGLDCWDPTTGSCGW